MAESTQKERSAFDKAAEEHAQAEAEDKAAEKAAPEEAPEAPEAPDVPVVKIKLHKNYSGPKPVHVSVHEAITGKEVRVEDLTEDGVEVPEALAPDFLTQPAVTTEALEQAEEADE